MSYHRTGNMYIQFLYIEHMSKFLNNRLSLWLLPQKKSEVDILFKRLIEVYSKRNALDPFDAHVTLFSVKNRAEDEVIECVQNLVIASNSELFLTLTLLATELTNATKCVFALIHLNDQLRFLRQLTYDLVVKDNTQQQPFPYLPHSSIIYDINQRLSPLQREEIVELIGRTSLNGRSFLVDRLQLVDTTDNDHKKWKVIRTWQLNDLNLISLRSNIHIHACDEAKQKLLNSQEKYNTSIQDDSHDDYIRLCNALAMKTPAAAPCACLLVIEKQIVLTAVNTHVLSNDITKHSELNLISQASTLLSTEELKKCILYTNVQPCIMCHGAILLSNIPYVVYSLSNEKLGKIANGKSIFNTDILMYETKNEYQLLGPILEDETAEIHQNYFNTLFRIQAD
ncbi:unnamed protein product [Didymodactylos carnosus]|uniref:CMP/dCMP-type deaminase domain-containing protein n=1 Tax=Didymodactylos carnosus TaxID=1234261 RepID=A0A813STT6_9BILA|nr:unnamed protein product [Didymodactylos carnosus]CAF0838908.1 unnamed protein product [Didymodactylos carnosus]CAF3587415.1 unnamed protein product [Didymodactylos carnosus]CAF3623821.1 unnamed protein product [Didymodactylos carnosus]